MKTPLEIALSYLKSGLSVIPIKPDGSKGPLGPWKRFQERLPTEEEIIRAFKDGRCGIGIICGEVSGGLEVIDFEDGAPMEEWSTLVKDNGGEEALRSLVIVKTPTGGYHVFYRYPGPVEANLKLAQLVDHDGKPKVQIETRGEGGYVLAPGSPDSCHPTGKPYRLIRGSLSEIPLITREEAELTRNCARAFNQYFQPRKTFNGTTSREASNGGSRPGDDFNARAEWGEILTPHGFEPKFEHDGTGFWTRPGKDAREGHSATTNYSGSDLLYVFSTNCSPLEPETSYSKFATHTFLNHGGDFSVAASELRQEGYGDQSPSLSYPALQSPAAPSAPASSWPVLDKAALQGTAGDFVDMVSPHSESDPTALLVQFLVCFGNQIGRAPYWEIEGDRHRLNLNCCLVGETSKGRKGTSFGQVKRVFQGVDAEWNSECIVDGLSSGEGLIWEVRDPIEGLKKMKGGVFEMVTTDEGVADKRRLVVEAEFSSTLKVMGRDNSTLSAIIRKAWDDGSLRTMAKNSPARATDAHIAIIGHITKDEVIQLLDTTAAGNGFGNRFLWVCVKRSKLLPFGGRPPAEIMDNFIKRVKQTSKMVMDSLQRITLTDEARELWIEGYPELSSGKPGLLGAMTGRAEAQTRRLACLYAALNCTNKVEPKHLRAALALWKYCEDSAAYIFGATLGVPIADVILTALKATPGGLSRTAISKSCFSQNQSAFKIDAALRILLSQHLIEAKTVKTGAPGRPAEHYVAK